MLHQLQLDFYNSFGDSHPYSRLYDIQTEPKLQDSKPLLPSYNMEVSLIWEQNDNHNLPN